MIELTGMGVYALLDGRLDRRDELFSMIEDENIRQLNKWGVQNRTPFEWYTYLAEEFGEVGKAIAEHVYRKGNDKEIIEECIQVATLSLKIAEMYMNQREERIEEKINNIEKAIDDVAPKE